MDKTVKHESYTSFDYFECACGQTNHLLRYRLELDNRYGPTLDLELTTPAWPGFIRRLWAFLRGDDCLYMGFDHQLSRESAERQVAILRRYLDELDTLEGSRGGSLPPPSVVR